jgi:hypothetical protein
VEDFETLKVEMKKNFGSEVEVELIEEKKVW